MNGTIYTHDEFGNIVAARIVAGSRQAIRASMRPGEVFVRSAEEWMQTQNMQQLRQHLDRMVH